MARLFETRADLHDSMAADALVELRHHQPFALGASGMVDLYPGAATAGAAMATPSPERRSERKPSPCCYENFMNFD